MTFKTFGTQWELWSAGLEPEILAGADKPELEESVKRLQLEVAEQKELAIATAKEGRPVRSQVPLQRFDGLLARIDFSLKPIIDRAGAVAQMQAVGRKIREENKRTLPQSSDRSLAADELEPDELEPDESEKSLSLSLSLLQSTLEALADGVLVLSLDGSVATFNQSLVQMWHIPESVRAASDSRQWLEFLALQCEAADAANLFQALYGSPELESHDILRLKDGRIFDCCSRPQRLGDSIVGKVWTFRDVTECDRAQSELRQSEARFRTLAEMTDAIIYIQQGTRFRYVNPAGSAISGYSTAELLEHPNFQKLMEVFEDSGAPEGAPEGALKQQEEGTNPLHKECRFVTESGEHRWLDCSISKIKIEGEMAVLGIAVDVTERKKAELAVHQALAREKELSEWRSHLVSMLSHEFGKPLNVVSFAASSLQNYGESWSYEKKSKYLARIQSAVHQIDRLLNDVLVIGCADAGKIKCNPEPLDVIMFCQEVVASIELETSSGHPISLIYRQGERDLEAVEEAENQIVEHIKLQNTPVPNTPKLFNLDAKLLEPILTNLLSNACKYSAPESPVFLKVAFAPGGYAPAEWESTTEAYSTGQYARATSNGQITFEIEDRGIGIPWADRQKLFEPFHRGENVGDIPGYGVGLAVVKKFVRLHGGRITCSSQLGKGTKFTVSLPANSS